MPRTAAAARAGPPPLGRWSVRWRRSPAIRVRSRGARVGQQLQRFTTSAPAGAVRRLHECVARGTPLVRPLTAIITVPPGLDGVLARESHALPPWPADTFRAVCESAYSPHAAAASFLDALAGARRRGAARRT